MTLFGHGRKLFLSALFLAQGLLLMGLSYALALQGKLVAEWVSLITIWLPMAAAVTVGFAGTNAYVSGKAMDAGLDPPEPTQPAEPAPPTAAMPNIWRDDESG